MKNDLMNLNEYNLWGNKRCLESLNSTDKIDKKAEELLSHIIASQLIWLTRITGKEFKLTGPWHTFNKNELSNQIQLVFIEWHNYISYLNESELNTIISYTNTKGEKYSNGVYDIIVHISHHSAYHRGQIASLVRAGGGTPAVTDYIVFKRE